MNKEEISKEINYKGHTKKFTVAIEQLPAFNPETMDKVKYEETQKALYLLAEEKLENQKFEWIFSIEQELQQ
ncbi:hypothetical protein HX001_01410 [Empedobacter brevis]|uniref:Uncharacterized protein n=2 Tax=Empedobacter brevis TaxID=247 RepID=A0A511NCE2_9FLAO|nr:hypothetical protein [Empedobacter brevis]MDM1071147.1 hypothetical protein [Empedobacter brevis]QHC85323.1 hypothetical protein AS589_11295 [Empedobacter brevis]GEM50489.1 hypothetical protein EB1_02790 [Empedobacter brevis NBRC 14943 = ATCC 43319]